MKLFCALLCSAIGVALAAFASVNPQLLQVKRVYILSMGSGMDQYLANQFTNSGIFEVVTDPKKADAIVTDNVGENFQKKVDDLYAPPPKPAPASGSSSQADPGAAAVDVGDNASEAKPARRDPLGDVDFSGGGTRTPPISRGKGNFFVVDRNSRIVLWSIYERPKNSTPGELTKTAARIVKHLKDDMTGPKPGE
jgi:hypothetical protein